MDFIDQPEKFLKKKIIPFILHGIRVDKAAKELFPEYSRTQLQEYIDKGLILHNGLSIKKRTIVAAGDTLSCLLQLEQKKAPSEISPQEMPFHIIYEDEDIFVINKPADLVVHPGAGNYEKTFVHGFLHRFPDLIADGLDPIRPGLVHRLDKDTTGVLISAKNRNTLAKLSEQFQKREVQKEYIALVHGQVPFLEKEIITQIGRSKKDRTKMEVIENGGKIAISHIYLEQLFTNASRIAIDLKTGRTHQIRVHLQHIGHPILGDKVYGGLFKKNISIFAPRQMLHCQKITLFHPIMQKKCTFIAKLPQDMLDCELHLKKIS